MFYKGEIGCYDILLDDDLGKIVKEAMMMENLPNPILSLFNPLTQKQRQEENANQNLRRILEKGLGELVKRKDVRLGRKSGEES